jgi:hypothetical protein
MSPLEELLLLPRNMMRLGWIRVRFTFLWLLLLDPGFLSSNLRTVWPIVPRDAIKITCRLASFVGMLLDRFYKFTVSILTNNKSLTFLKYMSPMGRNKFRWGRVFNTALFGSIPLILRLFGF